MKTYKSGNKTKTIIYNTSKELFYEHGYKNTSCAKIAHEANVNIALINYYFKTKSRLGVEVYNDFTNDLRTAIIKKVIEAGYDYEPIVAVGIEYYAVNDFKNTNKKFERFTTQLCEDNGLLDTEHYIGFNVRHLKEKYNINFTEEEMEHAHCCIASIINGMTVIRRSGVVPPRGVSSGLTLNVLLKILDFSKTQREEVIERAKNIFNNIDITLEKNFIVK